MSNNPIDILEELAKAMYPNHEIDRVAFDAARQYADEHTGPMIDPRMVEAVFWWHVDESLRAIYDVAKKSILTRTPISSYSMAPKRIWWIN